MADEAVTSKVLTPAAKKRPPNAGKGRVKGIPNRVTKELKDMILGALEAKGGQRWLQDQMDANPSAYMTLLGKIIPLQVTGKDGAPLVQPVISVTIAPGPESPR